MWAGVPAHYVGCELSILDIFSKYSFKIPQIYSIFPCWAGVEVLRARRAGGRTNNPVCTLILGHIIRMP
jgi:hypothetical protein